MKKFLLSFIGIAVLALGSSAQVGAYSVGDVVDNFTVTDTEGNEHTLYDITATGKHVYLDFFFDTCGPCQGASPYFGEFYDKYGCNGGEVYCLVINNGSDNDAEVIAYEEEFGGPGEHAPAVSSEGGAGAVDSNFGIGAYPTFCMIGPDNKLIESDIWPVSSVDQFEATFYGDFNPDPMACSALSVSEETELSDVSLYPNPAADLATISFSAQTGSQANIAIYNMLGEVIGTTITQAVAGANLVELDLNAYKSGNYIVQIQLGDAVITSKLEIIK
jgi:thiol-disulfide isomerase/thioredoxin